MEENRNDFRLTANAPDDEPDDEDIRTLLESAGRRPDVPAEDFAAIESAARRQWEELVAAERTRQRPRLRYAVPIALAASLILAVGLWWWTAKGPNPPPVRETLATVELLKGKARLDNAPGGMKVGETLPSGSVLVTGSDRFPGLVALRFFGGESVRLDAGTRVRLVSRTRIELENGAVYVDSGGGSLEIGTALGSVRETGTQFEVRIERGDDAALGVRVREGAVSVLRPDGSDSVAKGEEIRVRPDGSVSRATVDPTGSAWSWALAVAPSLDIDGRALSDYLDWVARETGWRLRYEDDALAGLASTIRLHGTIEGLAPDESVSVVLPGSGLGYRVEAGTLIVLRLKTRS